MSYANEIRIIGNAGADPELKRLDNGSAVVRVSLATSEKWVDKTTGELKEQTDWHIAKGWGPVGERMFERIRKGTRVTVLGRLKYDQWEKDGVKHTRAYVLVDGFEVSAPFKSEQASTTQPPARVELPGKSPDGNPVTYPVADNLETHAANNFDDLPF